MKVVPVSMSSVVFDYLFNVGPIVFHVHTHECPYTGTCMKSSLYMYKSFYICSMLWNPWFDFFFERHNLEPSL